MSRAIGCAIIALALSGCGDSGGGNVQSAPSPPVAVAPTPPPSKTPISQEAAPPTLPPVTTGTLVDALVTNADFRTGSTEVIYDVTAQTVQSRNKAYAAPSSIRVYFDSATGKYIVSNIIGTAHRFPDGFNTDSGLPFTSYGQNATDGVRRLSILTPSAQNPKIVLTYTSFGVWQFDSSDRGNIDPQINDYHFFYFGIPTPADGMPRTGTGDYTGVAQGVLFDPQATYSLDGSMTFGANFATGSIGTTLTLTGTSTTNGLLTIPVLNGTAAIGASMTSFLGTLTTADNSFVGSLQGAFFGPTAQEVGYSFAINSPDLTRVGGGVAVGKR
jgi:hypothetical protein